MGKRTSYEPGMFCWVELGTADAKVSTQFYASVLGWQVEEQSFEQGMYHLCKVDNAAVAGIFSSAPDVAGWMTYVSVDDVDKIVALAQQLGGKTLGEPMDIEGMGRMVVIQDPQGGIFSVWQPDGMVGAELVNDPGAFTMTQLNTRNPEKAQSFYGELFGWTFKAQSDEPPFWSIYAGEALNAGLMQSPQNTPDHWLTYFTVPDTLEVAIGKVDNGGGSIVVPPTQVPAGRFTVAKDPQSSFFALYEGSIDD